MKKMMICVMCFVLFIFGGTVKAAASPSLTVDVKGTLEAGQTIQILINVNNIDSFYAGAASLKYDPKVLKIISFEKGDLITKSGTNTYDAGDKIDNINGTASFGGFSCLGKVNGFSGSGVFLKINAQLLKKDSFHINSIPFLAAANDANNLKIQLCDKDIKVVSYEFKGYDLKVSSAGKAEVTNPVSTVPTNADTSTNATVPNTNSKSDVTTPNTKASTNTTTVTSGNSSTPSVTNSLTKTNKDSDSKSKAAANSDTGLISKIQNVLAGKDENSNKTQKSSAWQKGILIGGIIVLAFAGAGGVYFYRKKH